MKRKVKINTGFCGEDATLEVEFPDDITQKELDEWLWDMAVDHAESFGHEVFDEDGEVLLWNLEAFIQD